MGSEEEVKKQMIVKEMKEKIREHEKSMEILRHKNIMEEIELMGKYGVTHLERRTMMYPDKKKKVVKPT